MVMPQHPKQDDRQGKYHWLHSKYPEDSGVGVLDCVQDQ